MNYRKYYEKLLNKQSKFYIDNNVKEFKIKSDKGHTQDITYGKVKYNFVISSTGKKGTYGKGFIGFIVEIYINGHEYTKSYFEQLFSQKELIERAFTNIKLYWEESPNKKGTYRIYAKLNANIEDETKWDDFINWQIKTMTHFLKVFPTYTKKLEKNKVINQAKEILENTYGNRIEFISNTKTGNKMNIKNIILYGAPGVGKTHNYKKLISLIEESASQKEIFDSIQENEYCDDSNEIFSNIKKEKRVEFITFHQSFGYEDFIEGFRPNEEGKIQLEDGVFKLISNIAKEESFYSKSKTITFDEVFELLREKYIEDGFENISTVKNIEIQVHQFKERYLKVQSVNAKDEHYIKRSDLEIVVAGFIENKIEKPADIKLLDVKADTKSLSSFYYPIGKVFARVMQENTKEERGIKNFYLVIDEINRGNISKVFGELITLIEESKRDTYEVTLPYSKEKFKVPSNLYIIGTMNTTDKSIALIDVALRRRFTFIKMKPNSNLVTPSFKDTFEKLNVQIKKDLGDEYQIGHSYFMNIDESDLDFVKEYKIKPLLEEYYYGDEDKLKKALEIIGIQETND